MLRKGFETTSEAGTQVHDSLPKDLSARPRAGPHKKA